MEHSTKSAGGAAAVAGPEGGTPRVALVTGGNKGIGLEVVRRLAEAGLHVWLASREPTRGESAAQSLRQRGLPVDFVQLDVNDAASIAAAAQAVRLRCPALHVLVNNAGIVAPADGPAATVDPEVVRLTMETNYLGPLRVTQAFLPLLQAAGQGNIVNVSSGLGSLQLNADPQWEFARFKLTGYNTSKAALNLLTVFLAGELRSSNICVNAVSPEFTATDLNGHRGTHTVEQGAAKVVQVALRPEGTGRFLQAAGVLPW